MCTISTIRWKKVPQSRPPSLDWGAFSDRVKILRAKRVAPLIGSYGQVHSLGQKMPIATVKQLCTPSALVKSDSLVEQVAQIEDFASGKVDGRAFFQRNYFTAGLELLVRRGFQRLAGKSASRGLPARVMTARFT